MESISIFEIIKVGIGPSSSHTMGPWRASLYFLEFVDEYYGLERLRSVHVSLFGSLAKTGKGHGTDLAAVLGLKGRHYRMVDPSTVHEQYEDIRSSGLLHIALIASDKTKTIPFDLSRDLTFVYEEELPDHPNGLRYLAELEDGTVVQKDYYSVGGGFVITDTSTAVAKTPITTPYPCHSGQAILENCSHLECSFAQLVMLNEQAWRTQEEIKTEAYNIWLEIKDCIWRGMHRSGVLPGGLGVKRRASDNYRRLVRSEEIASMDELIRHVRAERWTFSQTSQWISTFALAVNEENADFGRVVTAPTNGAAGVLPAVMAYACCFETEMSRDDIVDFILVAGEIGTLFKKGATISAAMGGCQAEIGVSSAMCAGALTAIKGGSPAHCLMASEIAMEHHLGMTCDPIQGLVQVPCIERNAMGAIKAITASNMALSSEPKEAIVSFDQVVKTMMRTALDMNTKYKETAEGGLAISVSVPEC